MAEKRPSRWLAPYQGGQRGFLKDLILRIKLILRLMGDRRVNFLLKLLPVASLAYLIWPADLAPLPVIGVVDDAAILWLGSTLFVELCPPHVVAEHLKSLTSNMDMVEGQSEVVDAEAVEVKDSGQEGK